jgi:REP element-mobilizing transposase RayT
MRSTQLQRSPKGTRRTRVGRFSERNRIYHVITKTLHNQPVFQSYGNARILIDLLRQQQIGAHASSLAFVVMPDHLHWLLQLTGERSLSICVNAIKSGSTRRINTRIGNSGRLWQKGFYDHAIRTEEDLPAVARYIVANPVRAGIVASVKAYPHWDAVWL